MYTLCGVGGKESAAYAKPVLKDGKIIPSKRHTSPICIYCTRNSQKNQAFFMENVNLPVIFSVILPKKLKNVIIRKSAVFFSANTFSALTYDEEILYG